MPRKPKKKQLTKHPHPPEIEPQPVIAPKPIVNQKPLILFLVVTGLVLTFLLCTIGLVYWYISSFTRSAGISNAQLISSIRQGLQTKPQKTENRTNFLILGVDEIVDQKEGSLLTDTIIIASLDYQHAQLSLIPLPRDLWIEAFKTKINALYYYGSTSEDTTGKQFAASVISQIIGLPLHYTLVLNLESLEEIIDSLGGVEIDVSRAFTDDQFPRPDVDIHQATNEAQLYETVSFTQGPQTMDGATALKYIRSRHSLNQDEGNDLARSQRQQQLVHAIIKKLKTRTILKNPHILGNLYYLIRDKLDTADLSDQIVVSFAHELKYQLPTLKSLSIPVELNGQTGLIYHPSVHTSKQWVYLPNDPLWQEIHHFISNQLQ